jgi:hypothetical protein
MSRRLSRRQRAVVLVVNVALVAVAGLLAWMVYQNLFVRRPLPPVPHGVTLSDHARLAEIQERRKSPLALPTVVGSIAARNLFSPTRTEATTAAAAPSPPPTAAKPTLHGILIDGAASRAYLEDPTTRKAFGYALGDTVSGGRLSRIDPDRVVIERPDGPLLVLLRDPSKRRVGAGGPAGGPEGPAAPFPAAPPPALGIAPPSAPPGTPVRPWTVLPNPRSRQ